MYKPENATLNRRQELFNHCRHKERLLIITNTRRLRKKQKLLDMLIRKQTRFPSFSWFLQQKPKETKFRSDHCTGLCKDCEGPQLNLDSLTKFMRKLCRCRSKLCPKWICSCDLDDNGEVKDHCDCDPCDCD